jgi:hypothetical protein
MENRRPFALRSSARTGLRQSPIAKGIKKEGQTGFTQPDPESPTLLFEDVSD